MNSSHHPAPPADVVSFEGSGSSDQELSGRLLTYLLAASEAQRSAVADELDNGLMQVAAALEVRMGVLDRLAAERELIDLEKPIAAVRESVAELRMGLRRAVLLLGARSEDGDLEVALLDLGARATLGLQMTYHVEFDVSAPIPTSMSGVLYRIAQEGVAACLSVPGSGDMVIEVRDSADDWSITLTCTGSRTSSSRASSQSRPSIERLKTYVEGMQGDVVYKFDELGHQVVQALIPRHAAQLAGWGDLRSSAGLVMDGIELGLMIVRRDWQILYCNAAATELLDGAPDHFEGHNFWDAVPQLGGTKIQNLLREALDAGYEGSIAAPDGLGIRRLWFNPSGYGMLLQFDPAIERPPHIVN